MDVGETFGMQKEFSYVNPTGDWSIQRNKNKLMKLKGGDRPLGVICCVPPLRPVEIGQYIWQTTGDVSHTMS